MRSLRRQWREIERALRGEPVSEGRNQNNRDPLAIAVAALGLVTQVGAWIWWGGRLDQRVSVLESNAVEERRQQREESKEKVSMDGIQNVQIAGMQSDIRSIKDSVERIDRKIPERNR